MESATSRGPPRWTGREPNGADGDDRRARRSRSPGRRAGRTARREGRPSDVEPHGDPAQEIFIIFAEQGHEARLGCGPRRARSSYPCRRAGGGIRSSRAAHVPVAGDQPDRAVAAPLEPALGLLGVGAGVDRFRAEVDAAIDQPALAAEAADEVGLGHRRVGARRPACACLRLAPSIATPLLDPALAAGQDDDRVGPSALGRRPACRASPRTGRSRARRAISSEGAEAEDHSCVPQCARSTARARNQRRQDGAERAAAARARRCRAGAAGCRRTARPSAPSATGEEQQDEAGDDRPADARRPRRRARSCAGTAARPARRWRRCRASPRSSRGACRARRALASTTAAAVASAISATSASASQCQRAERAQQRRRARVAMGDELRSGRPRRSTARATVAGSAPGGKVDIDQRRQRQVGARAPAGPSQRSSVARISASRHGRTAATPGRRASRRRPPRGRSAPPSAICTE